MLYQKGERRRGLYKGEHPMHKIFYRFINENLQGNDPRSRFSREPRVLWLAYEYNRLSTLLASRDVSFLSIGAKRP